MVTANLRTLLVLLGILVPTLLVVNFANLPFTIPALKRMSGGVNILDLRPYYTAEEAYAALDAYGPKGRRLYYIGLATLDMVLPLLIAGALMVGLMLTFPHARSGALAVLPFTAAAFDYLENVTIMVLIARYPRRLVRLARAAGFFTLGKHAAAVSGILLIMLGVGRSLLGR